MSMDKRLQAKHIPDEAILAIIDAAAAEKGYTNAWHIAETLNMPIKVVLAKGRSMERRGLVEGCFCGCGTVCTRPHRVPEVNSND